MRPTGLLPVRAAARDAFDGAVRLAKLADGLAGAVAYARAVGLGDEELAGLLVDFAPRGTVLATLAVDLDGSAIRFLVAAVAAEPPGLPLVGAVSCVPDGCELPVVGA